MRIFDRRGRTNSSIAMIAPLPASRRKAPEQKKLRQGGALFVEAVSMVLLTVGLTVALRPSDAALSVAGPHPVWLAVLVLSARYGTRGFAVGLVTGGGVVAGAAALVHAFPAATSRIESGADLGALVATLLVAWVSSIHVSREVQLNDDLAATRKRALANETAASELKRAVRLLRARTDRLETSLTFLSDVAARMDWGDPAAAAQAALDLAVARLGARAAVVQLQGEKPTVLAWTGAWAPDMPTPDLSADRTAAAALARRRAVRGVELSGAGPMDSDLAAPLVHDSAGGNGTRGTTRDAFGVIALRGVPQAGADPALAHDLGVIATWLGRALARKPESARLLANDGNAELLPMPKRDDSGDLVARERAESTSVAAMPVPGMPVIDGTPSPAESPRRSISQIST